MSNRGYTLVELLVVCSILCSAFAAGYAVSGPVKGFLVRSVSHYRDGIKEASSWQ